MCAVRQVVTTTPIWWVSSTTNWAAIPGGKCARALGNVHTPRQGRVGATDPAPPAARNRTRRLQRLVFREADVVGHPLADLLNAVAGAGSCAPRRPAWCAVLSVGARCAGLAAGAARKPSTGQSRTRACARWAGAWGRAGGVLYPRNGWIRQPEEPKAAAVIAQRAADIVTRAGQPHGTCRGRGRTRTTSALAPAGVEGDGTGRWQCSHRCERDSRCSARRRADSAGWGAGRVTWGGGLHVEPVRPTAAARERFLVFCSISTERHP